MGYPFERDLFIIFLIEVSCTLAQLYEQILTTIDSITMTSPKDKIKWKVFEFLDK